MRPAPVAGSPFAGTVALDERPAGIDFDNPPTQTAGQVDAPPAAAPPPSRRSAPKDPWLPATPEPAAPAPKPAARPAIAPVPPEHKQSLYRKFDKG